MRFTRRPITSFVRSSSDGRGNCSETAEWLSPPDTTTRCSSAFASSLSTFHAAASGHSARSGRSNRRISKRRMPGRTRRPDQLGESASSWRTSNRLQILVEPNAHHLLNEGDVAMLQIAVERLARLWPDAVIHVITDDPARLEACCPGVRPVDAAGRRLWFEDAYFTHTLHRLAPEALSQR